jgi:hypothetical protein
LLAAIQSAICTAGALPPNATSASFTMDGPKKLLVGLLGDDDDFFSNLGDDGDDDFFSNLGTFRGDCDSEEDLCEGLRNGCPFIGVSSQNILKPSTSSDSSSFSVEASCAFPIYIL